MWNEISGDRQLKVKTQNSCLVAVIISQCERPEGSRCVRVPPHPDQKYSHKHCDKNSGAEQGKENFEETNKLFLIIVHKNYTDGELPSQSNKNSNIHPKVHIDYLRQSVNILMCKP